MESVLVPPQATATAFPSVVSLQTKRYYKLIKEHCKWFNRNMRRRAPKVSLAARANAQRLCGAHQRKVVKIGALT